MPQIRIPEDASSEFAKLVSSSVAQMEYYDILDNGIQNRTDVALMPDQMQDYALAQATKIKHELGSLLLEGITSE